MNRRMIGALWVGALWALAGLAEAGIPCADLTGLTLPDVRIDRAALVDEPVAHCKVQGTIGGRIGFSMWLPVKWNGRFTMGGSGGFVAPEDNQALRLADNVLADGYATASTDTGHRAGGEDGSWALDDLEAIVNYGHVAMHRAVATSKAVIAAHYGRAADTSLFFGCSNGGREAMQEAERYPADFDGIIAGAPALDFPGVAAGFAQITAKMFPDPATLDHALVTPADRRLLHSAIVEQCDALDGVADGILQDPTACHFDPASLACAPGANADCLSADKIAAIRTVYQGPAGPWGPLHVGYAFGAEATDANGWGSWLTGTADGRRTAAFAFGIGFMRYFLYHDPSWSYVGYDWGRFQRDAKPLDVALSATNTDLSAFRTHGGKLLMYHGWADVALPPRMTTDYVDGVYERDPTARNDVRLFMMPGVLHCAGGAGPWRVRFLEALEAWRRSGDAPDELSASYAGKPGARKLCAWPQQARYVEGDPDSVEAYQCR